MTLIDAIAKVPSPYDIVMTTLHNAIQDHFSQSAQDDFEWMKLTNRSVAYQWLVKKKWDSKHKIIGNPKLIKQIEPYGELLFRELELCIQCHLVDKNLPYKNAAVWFSKIQQAAQELQPRNWYKAEFIKFHKCVVGCLLKYQNPYQTDFLESLLPKDFTIPSLEDMSRLIDLSIALAQRSDRFRKDYWRPFLAAYTNFRQAASGPEFMFPQVEDGKLLRSTGSGKGRVAIAPNEKVIAGILTHQEV